MKKGPYSRYSQGFRKETVKMALEAKEPLTETARRLGIPESTLRSWITLYQAGKLEEVGNVREPLTEVEEEMARLKKELHDVKQERDILKKAAAYFAKESLHGTQRSKS